MIRQARKYCGVMALSLSGAIWVAPPAHALNPVSGGDGSTSTRRRIMNRWRQAISYAAIALASALALPAVAEAAAGTAGVSGSFLTFQSGLRTSNSVSIVFRDFVDPSVNDTFAVTDARAPVQGGTGCQTDAARAVCSGRLVTPPVSITLVRVKLGDGNDVLSLSKFDANGTFPPAQVNGGLGNDTITSSEGRDFIVAGAGVNSVRSGGGTDRLLMRNGRRDRLIDCGDGEDSAVVDRIDPLPISCENVEKPPT